MMTHYDVVIKCVLLRGGHPLDGMRKVCTISSFKHPRGDGPHRQLFVPRYPSLRTRKISSDAWRAWGTSKATGTPLRGSASIRISGRRV